MAAGHKRHFWEKLAINLPSDFEMQLIPIWQRGVPSAREAIWPGELYKKAIKFRPDILMTDWPLMQSRHLALIRLLTRHRCRLAIHLRGDIWTEMGVYLGEVSDSLRRRRSLALLSDYVSADLHFRSLNSELKSADLIMPICHWLESQVHAHLDGARTEVVYQGVDSSTFYEEKGLELKHPNVGIMQSYNIYPKVKALIKFYTVIKRMHNVTFYIIAGKSGKIGGQSCYYEEAEKALSSLDNVIFLPNLTYPDEVRRFLSACDIYALVTGLDCCPTTVLEASLVGRPVIASKVGGVPELIREGETGFCIDNRQEADWVNTIERLHGDPKYARTIGLRAREFVARNFDWHVIGPRVAAIAKTIME